jgi:predicted small secreted protein
MNKMTKKIIVLATVTSLLFAACQNNPKRGNGKNKNPLSVETQQKTEITDIAFSVAKNYFVKNTVKELDNSKIETAEKFNEIFGMATTMGKDGKPTEIDFTKQYVIAVLLPETDLQTTVEPISLQKTETGDITLTYRNVVGQKQSFTTKPNFAIIVDKTENGNITLNEMKDVKMPTR